MFVESIKKLAIVLGATVIVDMSNAIVPKLSAPLVTVRAAEKRSLDAMKLPDKSVTISLIVKSNPTVAVSARIEPPFRYS